MELVGQLFNSLGLLGQIALAAAAVILPLALIAFIGKKKRLAQQQTNSQLSNPPTSGEDPLIAGRQTSSTSNPSAPTLQAPGLGNAPTLEKMAPRSKTAPADQVAQTNQEPGENEEIDENRQEIEADGIETAAASTASPPREQAYGGMTKDAEKNGPPPPRRRQKQTLTWETQRPPRKTRHLI